MLQFLKDPKYDFMSWSRGLLIASAIVSVLCAGVLVVRGLNLGIEFTGGTELQLKYVEQPDLTAIRAALASAGIESQVVTTIGDPADHEVYIKIGQLADGSDGDADLTSLVTRTLRGNAVPEGRFDLNVVDQASLSERLSIGPLLSPQADLTAAAILEKRKELGVITTIEDVLHVPGMDESVVAFVRAEAAVGPLAVRSQSYIGPAIGRELMGSAVAAIVGSLIGMLLYIWIRFQLQWGFAAVIALAHDTVITLGLFSIFDKQMSLPVVAAFLTLVGYSVNDTVVVFDRIRENLQARAAGGDLRRTVNLSINQTLSRTVITSGLTFVVVFGLLIFGGGALNPFAFVLTVGVLIGTYSSIFIAAPVLVLLRERSRTRAELVAAPAGVPAASGGRAKKVRTS